MKTFPIQDVGLIPWALADLAYQRYVRLYGDAPPLEAIARRGGFSLAELGSLLRGYARDPDAPEDYRDWHRSCEFATKEILRALRWELAQRGPDPRERRRTERPPDG